jgi:sortase A
MVRKLVRVLGALLVVVGLVSVYQFVHEVRQQGASDSSNDKAFSQLIQAAAGPIAAPSGEASPTAVLPGGVFLKVTIPKLSKEMVAIDSDWNGLTHAPMVHYHDSPAPGQKGNVLVAFHREFKWQDIDRLGPGDDVLVQALDGRTYTYRVDFVKIYPPSNVSLLRPTEGTDLTLITCDPWLQDYNRMIFRTHLVAAPSAAPSAG